MKKSAKKKDAKKKGAKPTVINEEYKLFKGLDKKLVKSLGENILSRMGEVSISRLAEFVELLRVVAECASETQNNLHLYREVKPKAREFRILSGRAKKATRHSLAAFGKAEAIGKQLDELHDAGGKMLSPGWLNFKPARKALERISKKIEKLESQTAAVIHPSFRTGDEKRLADQAPRKLHQQTLSAKLTSAELKHQIIGGLYDEIKKFTGPQVPDEHVYKFITDFLLLLPRKMEAIPKIEATASSVKSFLQRCKSSNQPIL